MNMWKITKIDPVDPIEENPTLAGRSILDWMSIIDMEKTGYTGPDFQIGDMVTYHGSMTEYHNDIYEITDLFDYIGVPCARLNGYRFGLWIERCRVASIQHVIRVIEETHPNKGDSDGAAIYSGTDRPE